MISRRNFLSQSTKYSLSGLALGLMNPLFTNMVMGKEGGEPHFFLMITADGGMDSTMGLNPWIDSRPNEKNLFLGSKYDVLRNAAGTNLNLGPAAHALQNHASDLSIVNGVFMGASDTGHESGKNYINSSKSVDNLPDFTAALAVNHSEKVKILSNTAVNLSYLSDRAIVEPVSEFSVDGVNNIQCVYEQSGAFGQSLSCLANPKLEGREQFKSLFSNLETQYSEQDFNNNQGISDSDINKVVAGFSSNLFQVAKLNINAMLDSHSNFEQEHIVEQKKIWDGVSRIIQRLKETAYLDTETALFPNHVTIIVTTEFSRLPFLNATKGKDHNLFDNSVLLGGKGIAGGSVIGGSKFYSYDNRPSKLAGQPIDYLTGQIMNHSEGSSIDLIRPENIWKTIANGSGVDYNRVRGVYKKAKSLPSLTRS